jgi:hypothetical protein
MIRLVAHDPAWAAAFEAEAAALRDSFGPLALRIEHVGSTAVAGPLRSSGSIPVFTSRWNGRIAITFTCAKQAAIGSGGISRFGTRCGPIHLHAMNMPR